MEALGILVVAGLVLVPLALEYGDFRRAWGLGRAAAFGLTALVVPAVAVGLAAAAPLAGRPLLQWGVTVAVALFAYSLSVRAIAAVVEPGRAAGRR